MAMKDVPIICMVDFCRYNNGEGGCMSEFGHAMLEFDRKTAQVRCETFELTTVERETNNGKLKLIKTKDQIVRPAR